MDLATLQALIEMAERAPKTKGETLWLAGIVAGINAQLAEQAKQAAEVAPQNGHVVEELNAGG